MAGGSEKRLEEIRAFRLVLIGLVIGTIAAWAGLTGVITTGDYFVTDPPAAQKAAALVGLVLSLGIGIGGGVIGAVAFVGIVAAIGDRLFEPPKKNTGDEK